MNRRIWWLTKSHTNSFLAGWCCALLVFVIPTGLWLGIAALALCSGLAVATMLFGVEWESASDGCRNDWTPPKPLPPSPRPEERATSPHEIQPPAPWPR
jgi:hypothetical protein